jgi:short-subunit dehydrogenase
MRKDTGPSWQDKTALITGSSSGIGAAIARLLAHQGMKVVLVARRLERLTRLSEEIRESGGRAEVIPADLSLEADRLRIFQQVTANVGSLDLLINNAGLGWYGYYADSHAAAAGQHHGGRPLEQPVLAPNARPQPGAHH